MKFEVMDIDLNDCGRIQKRELRRIRALVDPVLPGCAFSGRGRPRLLAVFGDLVLKSISARLIGRNGAVPKRLAQYGR